MAGRDTLPCVATVDIDNLAAPAGPALRRRMTEEEFVAWCDEETWAEWVDGEVVLMNAVEPDHGRLTSFIGHLLRGFVDEHDLGEVLGEPVTVRLPRQRRRRSPDLFFFGPAKVGQVTRQHFEEAPDLVVEVVSPESRDRDRIEKFAEYEAAGVPEYWLADRAMRAFEVFSLGADRRYALLPVVDGAVSSAVLPGLFFRPEWIWQLRFPKVGPLLVEMAERRRRRLG